MTAAGKGGAARASRSGERHDPSRCSRRFAGCEGEPRPGRRSCAPCAVEALRRDQARRAELAARGKCAKCGQRRAARDRVYCPACLEYFAARMRAAG